MTRCELIDYSGRFESLIKLCGYSAVSMGDLSEIKEIISYIQLPSYQVQEGDNFFIFIIDNRVEGIKGFLAIWQNREMACLNIGNGNVWGKWEKQHNLLLTDEYEIGEEADGTEVAGRVVYNSHGIGGIYSQGRFYTILAEDRIEEVCMTSANNRLEQAI